MYDNDIIELNELREKSKEFNEIIERLEADLFLIQSNIKKNDVLEMSPADAFKDIETLLITENFTNEMLSRIIEHISIDEDYNVEIHFKLMSDISPDRTIAITHNRTYGSAVMERFVARVE